MSNNTDSDRDPQSTDEGSVKLGFYIASLILGFGGNSLVITVMSRKKQKRSIPRLFILNLVISDLSFIRIGTPVTTYTYISKIYQNSYYCRLLIPLLTIFYFVRIFTILSMAVHRCRLITHFNKNYPRMTYFTTRTHAMTDWPSVYNRSVRLGACTRHLPKPSCRPNTCPQTRSPSPSPSPPPPTS